MQQGPGGIPAGVGALEGLLRLPVTDRDLQDSLGVVGDELPLGDAEPVEYVKGGVFQADKPAAARGADVGAAS